MCTVDSITTFDMQPVSRDGGDVLSLVQAVACLVPALSAARAALGSLVERL